MVAEIGKMIKAGLFAFFVLGRSIGLMGHYFDQIRLPRLAVPRPSPQATGYKPHADFHDVPKSPEKVG